MSTLFVLRLFPKSGSNGRMLKSGIHWKWCNFNQINWVLTNHHVAGKAKRLKCRLYDGEEINAKLIGADTLTDLAVIQLNLGERPKNSTPLQVATFGDSDRLQVGDPCFAMGNRGSFTVSYSRYYFKPCPYFNSKRILSTRWRKCWRTS